MPVDPIFGNLFNGIAEAVRRENKRQRDSGYWVLCPSCKRKVVKKELIKKGCYVCGWKPVVK